MAQVTYSLGAQSAVVLAVTGQCAEEAFLDLRVLLVQPSQHLALTALLLVLLAPHLRRC